MCVLCAFLCAGKKLGVCLKLCCAILRVQRVLVDNWGPQALKLRCDERLGAWRGEKQNRAASSVCYTVNTHTQTHTHSLLKH